MLLHDLLFFYYIHDLNFLILLFHYLDCLNCYSLFLDLLFFEDLKFSTIVFYRIEFLIRSIFAIGSAWALQKRKWRN